MTRRLGAAYGALFALTFFGLFSNLDDRLLWGDEAETAVLAVSITRFGVPRVDDGRNVIANLPDRKDSNEAGIWTWSPWLDEYLAAGSFLVLGPSTLSARLPFAVVALASALLLARLAYRSTRRHEVALTALALYATCVPLLLHARQARYYAVLGLAELWLLHGLSRSLAGDGSRENWRDGVAGALHIALALACLFYCNYIVVPGNLIAIAGLGAIVWIRQRKPPVALAAGVGSFAALAAPWIFYALPAGQLGRASSALDLRHVWESFAYYASEIHFHFVPWIVLALPVVAFAMRRLRAERVEPVKPAAPAAPEARGSSDLETFVWLLLLASLLVYALSPLRFFRYLIPLAPPLIFLTAVLIARHIRPGWARAVLVAVLASSNAVSLAAAPLGSHRLDFPYLNFARSITSDYAERLDDVLAFLEEKSAADESVWVADPEFPLIFYTDLRIIDARYRDFPEDPPDWVFATSASGIANRRPLQLPVGVRPLYREEPLRVRRSPRGGNRPDPHAHAWFRVGEAETERMRIYRRR